ncbi:MAG: DUF87 domain-containing protein, partial [Tissierellales bacterium]|nr:DUF87 domain-containing protein [Tissierellales bacterium]
MQDYEKLGVFYLGKEINADSGESTDNLLLYDSKDLTTHAVCLGMTGSGKTGLCISLLEEAAIDGIPALIIDPKGDMTNLALQFPQLSAEEFLPWINKDEALKSDKSEQAYAQKQAEMWSHGLATWNQTGDRIKRLKDAAELTIFTPGSTAGKSISILDSFSAPPKEIIDDNDTYSERIASTATSLLGLLGIDADPLQSREHILLSTILNFYWAQRKDLDLSSLIHAVQTPPVTKVGIFDLEDFYPAKERFGLAMALNNLLAAPAFQTWFEGEALDIDRLLYTDKGKPRLSILYIAHLNDAERMFFIALLLNQVLSWMRQQSGTTSLRALLYFDEIFGYLPPIGNPPSKKPLMTLLKQARAFGLGIVIATQNPVDLDYKGLSNIGSWFIGRLQTERDRARVLDGLSYSTASFDVKQMDELIGGIGKRVFLLHNIHDNYPVLFQTRWALSYLRGPLTKQQIKEISQNKQKFEAVTQAEIQHKEYKAETQQPILGNDIKSFFLPIRSLAPEGGSLCYRAQLYAKILVHYFDGRRSIDVQKPLALLTEIEESALPVQWENSTASDVHETDFIHYAGPDARFEAPPAAAKESKNYKAWETDLKEYIYRSEKLTLYKSAKYKLVSQPEESERDFRMRMALQAREQRDEWTKKLREKYSSQIENLEKRIRTAEEKVIREQEQAKQQKLQTALNIGTTLLGAFLGRKTASRSTLYRAGGAVRSASRIQKETGDVARASENLEILKQQFSDLQEEFQKELNAGADKFNVVDEELETILIRPTKTGI